MTARATCGACAFWAADGACRRRAPWPSDSADQVAHWPSTGSHQGCGDGRAPAAQAIISCKGCRFWATNPGGGLDPQDRLDERRDWWNAAGHCTRHAPAPSSYPGCRGFWRATHASDGCAEGEQV